MQFIKATKTGRSWLREKRIADEVEQALIHEWSKLAILIGAMLIFLAWVIVGR